MCLPNNARPMLLPRLGAMPALIDQHLTIPFNIYNNIEKWKQQNASVSGVSVSFCYIGIISEYVRFITWKMTLRVIGFHSPKWTCRWCQCGKNQCIHSGGVHVPCVSCDEVSVIINILSCCHIPSDIVILVSVSIDFRFVYDTLFCESRIFNKLYVTSAFMDKGQTSIRHIHILWS